MFWSCTQKTQKRASPLLRHNRSPPSSQEYGYPEFEEKFKIYLSSLKYIISNLQKRAEKDEVAVAAFDRAPARPVATTAAILHGRTPGAPKARYAGSNAQKLVRKAIAEGSINDKTPTEMKHMNEEYDDFELPAFRNHLVPKRNATKSSRRDGSTTRRRGIALS